MKILWLTNIPSPYRVAFFNLLGMECDLTVIFEKKNASDRNKSWEVEQYINFKGIIMEGMDLGNDNALCLKIIKYLKKGKFDIIVVSNYSTPTGMLSIQFMKLMRIPYIIEVDGGFAKRGSGFREKLKKYLIGSAQYWFSSGEKTSDYLIAYGADVKRIFCYPFTSVSLYDIENNIANDTEKLLLRHKLKITGERVAVAVGQFIYRKGFDILIKSWARIDHKFTLLIIGEGELEAYYKELIDHLSLGNVEVIGFKQKDELYRYYRAADLFILPTREDIWGLVVNEAMANGLPVITSDKCIAGLELVDENVNGFIFSANNEQELGEKVGYLLASKELIEHMAENSLKKIRNYTLENMVRKHIDYFNEIHVKV